MSLDTARQRLLKLMGLVEPPPDPDSWVPVVADLQIDDAETGSCEAADRIAERLESAGIEVRRQPYVVADTGLRSFIGGRPVDNRLRAAVLVRSRDLERAAKLHAEGS